MKTKANTPVKISRADVLRLTWQLVRNASLSFSDALKKAWATIRLKAEMLIEPVSFFYRKDNGTERFAVGVTTQPPTTCCKTCKDLVWIIGENRSYRKCRKRGINTGPLAITLPSGLAA